jgi:protein TonB
MKKILLVVSLFFYLSSFSQDEEDSNNKVYNVFDTAPQPPGGMNSFRKMIAQNFIIPNHLHKGFIASVVVRFVVSVNGKIQEITIMKSNDDKLSEEAIRVIKLSENWTPGLFSGNPVNCYYSLPIKIEVN